MEEFVNGNIFFSRQNLFEGTILSAMKLFNSPSSSTPCSANLYEAGMNHLQLGMGAVNKNGHYNEIEELWYGQKTPWDYNLSWAHQFILETISF